MWVMAVTRRASVHASWRAALWTDEDPCLGRLGREPIDVPRERLHDVGRDGNRAPTRFGLGPRDDPGAVLELDRLLFDAHRRLAEVEVSALKAEQLPHAEPTDRRQEHESPKPGLDGVGEAEHFGRLREWALWRSLGARTADATRRTGDEAVGNRGVEHRPQESVRLGGLQSAHLTGDLTMPIPDSLCRDAIDRHGPERWCDQLVEQAPIQLAGPRAQVSSGQPPLRMVGEGHRSCPHVDEIIQVLL